MTGRDRPLRVSADTSARPRRFSVRRAVALLVVAVVAMSALGALDVVRPAPAAAAPGDPFDPDVPTVFIGQDVPTRLYTAVQGPGTVTFTPEGATADRAYNAIGYNTNNNYLYAIRRDPGFTNALQRIGQDGVIVGLGPVTGLPALTGSNQYNQGDFGAGATADILYVRTITSTTQMWAVDVTTNSATSITLLAPVPNVSDFVYKDGFLWGLHSDDRMYRIDPQSGAVDSWPTGLGFGTTFGAQWRYGNGNIGVSANVGGTVHQIAIHDATTSSPTFELIWSAAGPPSGNNDGAASAGADVDLGIVKTGPTTYAPGDAIDYTLTVTNNGPGNSSGFVVKDTLPTSVVGPSTSTPGCSIAGNDLQCVLGGLPVGDSVDIEISGTISLGAAGELTNTATVIGNELDPNPDNDSSTSVAVPEPQANLQITKTPTPAIVTAPGQEVTYTFEVTNTSDVPIDDIVLTDVQAPPAGALTTGPTCPATTLAAQASMTCTATYTATLADIDHGRIDDTATATGDSAGTPIISNEATATVLAEPVRDWSIEKTAFLDGGELEGGAMVAPGDTLTYRVTVTSDATVDIVDVVLTDDLSDVLDDATFVPGSAELSIDGGAPVAVVDPVGDTLTAGPFTLPAGATAILTYQVTVDEDAWSTTLTNSVTGDSPTAPPLDCDEECTTTQVTPSIVQILKVGENSDGDVVPMDGSAWAIYDAADATTPVVGPVPQAMDGGVPVTGLFRDATLVAGTYWIEETVALDGFELLAQRIEFSIDAAGVVTLAADAAPSVTLVDVDGIDTIRVEDVPALELPDAGGPGTSLIYLIGIALIVTASVSTLVLNARARSRRHLAEAVVDP
ncbi:MAG: DUF6923 family protein [Actinomycetota bacterium]